MSRDLQVTFDCHDPRALSTFWRDALGYVHPGPPGVALADGEDPLAAWDGFLERLGVPERERNTRSALEAECARLVTLGARRVERHEPAPPMAAGHLVMADPEGNEFCLD